MTYEHECDTYMLKYCTKWQNMAIMAQLWQIWQFGKKNLNRHVKISKKGHQLILSTIKI